MVGIKQNTLFLQINWQIKRRRINFSVVLRTYTCEKVNSPEIAYYQNQKLELMRILRSNIRKQALSLYLIFVVIWRDIITR